MPETTFTLRWPDGTTERCYSPSLVVHEHLADGVTYAVADLVARSRTALTVASDRVQARWGHPCLRAQAQLARIEQRAARFEPTAPVLVDGRP